MTAVTAHAITGSDLGTNFFRIDGPDIGGPGINTIQTNLFTLQGRVATNSGVSPTSVTYTRTDTSGGFIDAFATSNPDQVIQVSGTGISTTKLKAGVVGRYFGRVAYTGANPPASVQVINTSDRPPTMRERDGDRPSGRDQGGVQLRHGPVRGQRDLE